MPRLPHARRRFSGRDPEEEHRSATPLELLYDLTIVVAFGTAADELAHFLADGHLLGGIAGFLFAAFAVSWAWLTYTWFASAYDTDDWVFRLATLVQMAGVVVLTLGIPQLFASIDHGDTLDNGVMVAGYVVMRVALLGLWAQVARHDPARARTARSYLTTVGLAQVGWVVVAVVALPVVTTFALMVPLFALELGGPRLAEGKAGTPWHPRHIAERYGLLVIITLGEVIIGTVAALNALVHGEAGWSVDAALLALAGLGTCFALWWMYFAIPWEEALERRRDRAFAFGYGHLLVFAAIAAIGAGLHVAAYRLEGEAEIGVTGTVLTVAVPLGLTIAIAYALYAAVWRTFDPFHVGLVAGTAAVLVLAVALAAAGASVAVCLLVLMLAPVVTVVGFETVGHEHQRAAAMRL
jgi:low temperature requirement protein LtrA